MRKNFIRGTRFSDVHLTEEDAVSLLEGEFSRKVKILSIEDLNGKYAITYEIGKNRNK